MIFKSFQEVKTIIKIDGNGEVKFWDIRKDEKSQEQFSFIKGSMNTFVVHDCKYIFNPRRSDHGHGLNKSIC
jgi:hypothetical protein